MIDRASNSALRLVQAELGGRAVRRRQRQAESPDDRRRDELVDGIRNAGEAAQASAARGSLRGGQPRRTSLGERRSPLTIAASG